MSLPSVIAKVISVRRWKDDEFQMLVTFETLQPFLNIGCNHAQLANKTHKNYPEYTLFVNKDESDRIGLGFALFVVSIQTYPKIQFIEMVDPESLAVSNIKLDQLEQKLIDLTEHMRCMQEELTAQNTKIIKMLRSLLDQSSPYYRSDESD